MSCFSPIQLALIFWALAVLLFPDFAEPRTGQQETAEKDAPATAVPLEESGY